MFKILGLVRVSANGHEIAITATRERTLLAMLLLHANSPVTTDQLIDETWPAKAPQNTRRQLQRCVHRLRRLLAGAGVAGQVILTEPVGYRAALGPADLDLFEFRRLVAEGRAAAGAGRYDEAAATYRTAGSLWSGPALAGVEGLRLRQAGAALDEENAQALEELFDAELAAGGAGELVPELTDLVRLHPHRERLHRALMLALYRAGRQADALAAYRHLHQLLRDDLGTEPARELRDLQKAVLNRDPGLDLPRAALPPPGIPTPHELPADVAGFTGRADALDTLDQLAAGPDRGSGAVVISAITGSAGVGKTALAVHWAHRVAGRFPDGQLFLDLRGYAAGPPLRPVEALAVLLRSLGTPPPEVPADLDEAARLYRTLLAGRQLLVVLDNAASADQVRPLLPGSPTCHVIVTSRDRLSGLVARDGAHPLVLDVLVPAEARALLVSVLGGGRVEAEPEAAAELTRACGYLPLAIRIAAANLTLRPDRTLAEHVDELLGGDRLHALQAAGDEHNAVGAAFDLSYQRLSGQAQRLFRMLPLVPGPTFTPDAAAALAGIDREDAHRLLDRLAGASLLHQCGQTRYSFHDLLHLYAQRRSLREDGEPDRRAGAGRLLRYYLGVTSAAVRVVHPKLVRLPLAPSDATAPAVSFREAAEALAWLEAERPNLVAAVRRAARLGEPRLAWLIADELRSYLWRSRYLVDLKVVTETALAAARGAGDLQAEAAIRLAAGNLHEAAGRYPAAVTEYTTAFALAERAGWVGGQPAILVCLGGVHWSQGQLQKAAGRLAQALARYRQAGKPGGEAIVLTNLGNVCQELGRLRQAFDRHSHALTLCRQTELRGHEAIALHNLGEVCHELGRYGDADRYLARALALHREVGSRSGEAGSLAGIAALHRDQGRLSDAHTTAQAALTKAREIGDRRSEAEALNTLGGILVRLDQHRPALECHRQALELALQTGDRNPQNRALLGLAASHHHLGNRDTAARYAMEALELAHRTGYGLMEGDAMTALAEIRLGQGRHEEADALARRAIDNHRDAGHRPGEARALVALGNVRQATGRLDAAARYRREARAAFSEIGAPLPADLPG